MDVEHADASVGKEKTIKRTLIDEEQVWADAESRAELKYPDASEAERQALANADAVESWLRKVNFLLLEKQGLSASQHCQGGEDCSLCASQQCEHPMRTTLIQYTQDHPSPSCMERNSPDKQRAEYLVPLRNPSLPAEPPFGVAVRCGCAVHAQMRALCDHCAQSEQTPSTDRRRGGGGETTTKAAAKSHSQPPLPSPPAGSYRFKHRVPAAELRRCFECGSPGRFRCAGCQQARYCSRKCQSTHWRRHKLNCRGGQSSTGTATPTPMSDK